jgi:hypothetical protein
MAPDKAGAAALRGNTYTSNDFGYSVKWDDSIWTGEQSGDADGVRLSSDISFGMIQAVGYEGDLSDCVADSVTGLAGQDNVSDFGKASRKLDRPATAHGAEGELFSYLDLNNDEAEVTMYIECRELGVDGTLLQVVLLSFTQAYPNAIETWESLLDKIAIDGTASSNGRDDEESEDDNSKSTREQAGLDGDTYLVPELGFSATWDEDIWSVRELEAEDEMGTGIEISSDATIGYITVGDELDGDLQDCAVAYAKGVGEYEAISKMKKASRKLDAPVTDADAAGALYTFTQTTETDEAVKMVGYFECRLLAGEESVAMILLATTQDAYADELGVWDELLAGIEIDGSSQSADEQTDKGDQPSDKSDDQDDKGDKKADKTEEKANVEASFVGPNFGVSVAVGETVWTIDDLSDENNDFLDMKSEFAIGSIVGFGAVYDPESCLELLIGLKAGDPALSFDVAPESMKRPKLANGATGELFVYFVQGDEGPIDLVMYAECRPLAGGDASLGIALVTVPEAYEVAQPEFNKVLKGISAIQAA